MARPPEQPLDSPPQVSVVTATWNSAATLEATLQSVAGQTAAARIEHLIIDGASTDRTVELARGGGGHVRVWSEPDRGIYEAFNKGVARARGELVAFLGSDDVYAGPDVLERAVQAAERHPQVDVFHGDLDIVDASGQLVREARFSPRHAIPGPRNAENYAGTMIREVFHPATFVRRRVFDRVGFFDPGYRIAGDVEWLLRAYRAGAVFRYLPHVLVRMRNDGISSRRRWEAELEVLEAFRRHSDSPWRPYAQLGRELAVAALNRSAPRLLSALRRVKGSSRVASYGERLRSEARRPPDEGPPPASAPR